MKLGGPRLVVALASLTAVLFVGVVDLGRTSPGPLTTVHGRVDELQGRSGCAECHGGWFSSMTDACLECHEVIASQMQAAKGLHGTFAPATAASCGTCHGEHHGESFALVNRASFRLAGVPDVERFDHALVGWTMDGAHTALDCAECHAHADVAVLPAGAARYGGLAQDCASCHDDPHEGRFASSCASCHGQTAWDELFSLGHEEHLELVGGHGDLDCRACHAQSDAHSLEIVGGRAAKPDARACADCHESPHSAPFAQGTAALAARPIASGCIVCHAAEHTSFGESASTLSTLQHSFTGFPLDAPHDDQRCEQCHDANGGTFAERHPRRAASSCSACHADPHGGQFATGAFAGQECTACHADLAFTPHTFTLEKHQTTAFVLDGAHESAECNACHTLPSEDAPRTFHGTESRCEQCHMDSHEGFFAAREELATPDPRGDCARCHSTLAFDAVPPSRFDHAHWTGFPIEGAHAQSDCASCHPSMRTPDASGRTFGKVAAHFGTFQGCHTCHGDPHDGAFDVAGLPPQIAGRESCERCHDASSFRSFPHGFEHGVWTGFTLRDGHARAACADCHMPLRPPLANGRTWDKALGSSCSDCHADPHAGQFDVDGGADCARCHDSGLAQFLDFDHDRDSDFRLGEQHANVACDRCHVATPLPSGGEVVRYTPLPTQCVDCHGQQEDALFARPRRKP